MILPTHIVATGGIIFDDNNEDLLIKNPRKGWEYPGGIVENRETVVQGLKREIKEESDVEVDILNMVGIYSNTKEKKGYNGVKVIPTIVTIDFICRYKSGELTTSEESNEVKWFTIEEALKNIIHKSMIRFKKALEYKSSICCVGYQLNDNNELEVHEEYMF